MKKIITILFSACLLSLPLISCSGEKPKELTDEDIATYSANMDDNIYSGDVTINGVKYTLPVKLSEMKDNHFNLDSVYKQHQKVKKDAISDPFSIDYPNSSGKSGIKVTIVNDSNSEVDIDDTKIYKMDFNDVNNNYINTIVLPKGITPKSTYNDILNTYGKPKTDFIAAGGGSRIDYEDPNHPLGVKIIFEFESDNQTIKNIILKH